MYAVVPTIPISFPKRILLDSLDDPISKLPFDVMRSLSVTESLGVPFAGLEYNTNSPPQFDLPCARIAPVTAD